MEDNSFVFPDYIELETVRGICSADCPMCSINETKYNKRIMSNENFEGVLDSFGKSIKRIKKVIICGLGEVLLDKNFSDKIRYAKSKGIPLVGAPSNGSHLTKEKSIEIMEAGLGEIILGIDSLKKENYERVRKNLVFENIIENTINLLEIRDKYKFNTKIHIRMILSKENQGEWEDYKKYWSKYVDYSKGDLLLYFPEHNWSEHDYENSEHSPKVIKKTIPCTYVEDRINIDAHGNVKLCCIDVNATFYDLGNVFKTDPIEIFNNKIFKDVRKKMNSGNINKIKSCAMCTVPIVRARRGFFAG